MRNIMSRVIKSSIIGSIGLILLGILLVIQAEATIISLSYIIGGILIAIGTLTGIKYTRNLKEGKAKDLDIVYSIVCVVLGILVISNPEAIGSVIPLVIGLIIVVSSAFKIKYALSIKKDANELWKSTFIIGIITMVCGLILVFNPFKGAVLITMVVGILIILYGILDIISTLTIRNTVNSLHKAIEEKIIDADIIEDNTDKEKKKNNINKDKSENEEKEED